MPITAFLNDSGGGHEVAEVIASCYLVLVLSYDLIGRTRHAGGLKTLSYVD
uniref:Uncharacterized protein n=1 Tax=Peronospora matthiolae TaxID=2874970 RepID=A0AAV1T472_9STRA